MRLWVCFNVTLLVVGCSLNPQGELPGAGEGHSPETSGDGPAIPGLDDGFADDSFTDGETDDVEPEAPDVGFDDVATDDEVPPTGSSPAAGPATESDAGGDAGVAALAVFTDGGAKDAADGDGGEVGTPPAADAASDAGSSAAAESGAGD